MKSWQEAVNGAAILKEMHAFQFNTYIISVLVIFYLQLNQNFPKLAKVPASQVTSIDKVPPVDGHLLKQSIRQFFEFYGNFYEINDQVISVHVGQWENRKFDKNPQHELTPEQKRFVQFKHTICYGYIDFENFHFNAYFARCFRLRDGMSSQFGNWGNCTMFVEDLNAIGKNITAEIPTDHAVHFKEMCKLFALISSHEHDQAIDEYLLKLSQAQSANATNGSAERTVVEIAGCSSQSLQREDPRIRKNLSSNHDVRLTEKQATIPRLPATMETRQSFELEIFTIVVQFIHDLDPTMKLFPFGSTQYGIKYPNANFNLLVTTGEFS